MLLTSKLLTTIGVVFILNNRGREQCRRSDADRFG